MRRTSLLLASGITAGVLACDGKTLPLEGDSRLSGGGMASANGGQSGGYMPGAGTSSGSGVDPSADSGGSAGTAGGGGNAGKSGSAGMGGIYCDPGEYAVEEGTRSAFACTPCLVGTFNDDPAAAWCPDCLMCGSLRVVAACTPVNDAECEHIGVGKTVGQVTSVGATFTEAVLDLAADASGNVWLVGHASDVETSSSPGAFLRKYPMDGSATSIDLFASNGYDVVVAVAPSGAIWVAGITTDDLGGSAQGAGDVYVRRYDPGGERPMTDHFGTSSAEHVGDITADPLGNVWVVGDTAGDLLGTKSSSSDVFVRTYTASGETYATGQFGGPDDEHAYGIAVDAAGNVWIAEQIADSVGNLEAAVMKLPASGGSPVTDRLGTAQSDSMGVAVDPLGNAWVVADVDGGALIRKYPADGSAPVSELIGDARPRGVAVDKDGNVWVVGEAQCNVAEDPLLDAIVEPSNCAAGTGLGSSDSFMREYPADGATPHSYQFGTRSVDGILAVAPAADYGVWILGVRSRWQESIWHVRP